MKQSEAHEALSDEVFADRFKNCSLNEIPFTHRAHLRLAWIHLEKYGEDTAIKNICQQLQAYTRFVGAEEKYNHTLTIAAVKAVRYFADESSSDNFDGFIREFPFLETDFRRLIGSHYSIDVFNHLEAKTTFLEPDLDSFR